MKVKMFDCQKRLSRLWYIYAGILMALLIAQTLGGKYSDQDKIWQWFLASVMPTLSLISGGIITLVMNKDKHRITIDRFFYRMAWWVSFVYLSLLLLTLSVENLTSLTADELQDVSSLWLIPVQGIVAVFLGIFFNKGEKESELCDADRAPND
ncbi:MAG: putative membrane protein [Flavobacteriales bacterium]|jgi:uncharacterized membrane protein